MDAKQYLSQMKRLRTMIENKRAEIEQWKAVAYGITPQADGERVQATGKPDRMATAVCNYATIEAELEKQIARYGEIMLEVVGVIEQLEEPYYSIIHKHYMENKKLVKEKPLYPQWPGLSIYTQVTLDKSKIVGFR